MISKYIKWSIVFTKTGIVQSCNYYGGLWASFNLDTLTATLSKEKSINKEEQNLANLKSLLNDSERILQIGNSDFGLSAIKQQWHIPE